MSKSQLRRAVPLSTGEHTGWMKRTPRRSSQGAPRRGPRFSPTGPRRCRGVGAQLHFAAQDRARAALVHDQQHEVSSLPADLKPETAAFERHHRRRAPGTAEVLAAAARHHAPAVTGAHYKGCLQNRRQDDHAIRFVDQILRNVVRDIHNLFRNFAGVPDAVSFFCVVVSSAKRRWIDEGKQANERCHNTKVPRFSHLTSSSGWVGLIESEPLFTGRLYQTRREPRRLEYNWPLSSSRVDHLD